MTDYYERARFSDFVADFAAAVREARPDVQEADLRAVEIAIKSKWAGTRVTIGKRIVHDTERIREMIREGVPERTARRKVRGR